MSKNTIDAVLVHGAWAGASSWQKVAADIQSNDINVVTVTLPLSTFAADVDALDRVLDAIDGPAILVGHAYAGAVIGATRSAKVQALVYVAGLAPDQGETVADVFYRFEQDALAPKLAPDGDGWIYLPTDAFATAFAQHATPAEQALLAREQPPISPACITAPVERPRWHDVPTWYLLAEQDHMIPAQAQRFMAERMHAHISTQAVDHLPSVSAPDTVTALIMQAARQLHD